MVRQAHHNVVQKTHHKVKKTLLKVYTKTGDKGETSLFGGKRVLKYSLRVEAYGTVDELNSAIGVAISQIKSSKKEIKNVKKELIKFQHDLFDIGASLANPNPKYPKETSEFLQKRVSEFEKLIDKMAEEIPDFQCFILPGVGKVGSELHLCRTIARRAERRVIELAAEETINRDIIIYLNRLSDLLFTLARFVNFKEKKKEVIWQEQF